MEKFEDLKEDVSLLASYNDNQSSDSYLHIYYEDGVVKDALYGPYKIDNLVDFCKEHNFSTIIYTYAKNNKTYKGWKIQKQFLK